MQSFQSRSEIKTHLLGRLESLLDDLAVAELTKSKLYTFDKQQEDAFEAISKNW